MNEEEMIEKTEQLLYWLVKEAARDSFMDWLEESEFLYEEWVEVKANLIDKLGIDPNKMYL